MIKKVLCLLAFGAFSPGFLMAQSISYKTLTDDPDMRNVSVSLNIADFIAYTPNMSFAWNAYAHARLGKLLIADVDIRRSYSDAGASSLASENTTKGFQTRVGGRFNLVNTIKSGTAKVVLSSYTAGNYRHTTYINVPATYRKIFSVRGGLQTFKENASISSVGGSKDDIVMYYKDAAGNKTELRDKTTFKPLDFSSLAVGFYGGISFQSIVNVIIQAEGYGKRSRSIANDFYADVLLTPVVTYSLTPGNDQKAAYGNIDIDNDYNSKRYIGWRVGWQAFMGRKIGLTSKCEFGQMPGIAGVSPWFVSVGIGIGIGANIPGLTKFGNKNKK